ncbi:unnamed protein product, partial [Iphiclides podalirius]
MRHRRKSAEALEQLTPVIAQFISRSEITEPPSSLAAESDASAGYECGGHMQGRKPPRGTGPPLHSNAVARPLNNCRRMFASPRPQCPR